MSVYEQEVQRITSNADPETAAALERIVAGDLSIRFVTDAVADPPPEPPTLVDGMLRAGELCVIAAPRGIGKSFWAQNIALLLARGEGLVGGTLRVKRPARVLLSSGEVDPWESSRRWAMLTGRDTPPEGLAETFDRWRIRIVRRRSMSSGGEREGRYSDTQDWIDAVLDSRLEATIAAHRFDVLIIDPWAVYFAGAENSNDETEAALDKLRDLAIRHHLAVVIVHHLGKATDAREPEDLWRGASRLADWASTRVTILPHWTEKQAADQGMTRQQARRFVDVRFLRRSTPTDDFSMKLDPDTGWWDRWSPPNGPIDERRIHLEFTDLVTACEETGGSWPSTSQAAAGLGVAVHTAQKLLESAVLHGHLERFPGPRGAHGYRIPTAHLQADVDTQESHP